MNVISRENPSTEVLCSLCIREYSVGRIPMNAMSVEKHLLIFHPLDNLREFTLDRNLMNVTNE